eukprot:876-Heterococcus_DN1.PRE.5
MLLQFQRTGRLACAEAITADHEVACDLSSLVHVVNSTLLFQAVIVTCKRMCMCIYGNLYSGSALQCQCLYVRLQLPHSACRQWEQAEQVVQDMIECNVQPDQYTYNSLINAYAKKRSMAVLLPHSCNVLTNAMTLAASSSTAATTSATVAAITPAITFGCPLLLVASGQWAKALAAIATMRDKSCSAVSISALLLLALLSTATITTAEQYCHYIILHYSQYYTITATVTATSCSY